MATKQKGEAFITAITQDSHAEMGGEPAPEPLPVTVEAPAPPKPWWETYEPPKGTVPPDRNLTYVKCDLPGYEHIEVGFKCDNMWRLIHSPVDRDDPSFGARFIMLLARDFRGWNLFDDFTQQPIPAPHPPDLRTYLPLVFTDMFPELGTWCTGPGYEKAREASLGPNT